MLERIKAVIFDLDGTLADSMGIWKQIDIDYLGRFGILLPDRLQSAIDGMSFTETAYYFKERFHLEDSIEEIKRCWNDMAMFQYRNEVSLKDGAANFVKHCSSLGLKLGIASSNSKELIEQFMEGHGLRPYFHSVVTACEAKKGKPAPDVYLMAARVLGVEPREGLVFEDIVMGIQAGKAAGMKVCAVEDDYSKEQREEKRRLADYYIDSYASLLEEVLH